MMLNMPSRVVRGKILTVIKWIFFSIVLLLLYFPILYIITQSFNASATGSSFTSFTFKWYMEIFYDRALMQAIYNTISMALLATIISVIAGTLFAIGINSMHKKRRSRLILLNNIPILNAEVVTGVFLMLIFRFIAILLNIEIFGYTTMLISHVFFCIPYVVLSVLPKLNEIDYNLYDAALDLGCTPFEALMKVIIPSIKTGIIAGALIAFTMSIDDFVISYMTMGRGVQNFSIWLYLIKNPLRNNAMQKASAYNTLISVGTIIILIVYNILRNKKGKVK